MQTSKVNDSELAIIASNLETSDAQDLRDALRPFIEKNPAKLIVDLSGVEVAGRECLKVLNETRMRLRSKTMVLKGVNENIMKVLRILGFDSLFEFE